jgi:hypothetical protein
MKPPIWMAPSESRCSGRACTRGLPCARKDIADGVRRPLADFSVPGGSHVPECNAPLWRKFVSHAQAVRPEAAPVVKEWIGQ